MRTITAQAAVKFIRGLVCRFGVPNRIITDNGTQFTSGAFLSYCEEMGIKVCFASVAHPRSNGQVECANAEVMRGLKTQDFRQARNLWKELDRAAALSPVVSPHDAKQGNQRNAVLPRLRGGSGSPHRTQAWISPGSRL